MILKFQFVMKKARRGYGFTVAGTCPVTVSKVESGMSRSTIACLRLCTGQNQGWEKILPKYKNRKYSEKSIEIKKMKDNI